MSATQIAAVEPGNRIQIPDEWAQALGLQDRVVLDRTADGILIRPQPKLTWDEFFATKLVIGSATTSQNDELELSGDDLLF